MAYCTTDDIKAIKSVTALLTVNSGQWLDSDISALIDRISDNEIDPRISKLYDTHISPAPDILKEICILKSVYEMLQQEYGESEGQYSFFNKKAEMLLKKVETGEIKIGTTNEDEPRVSVGVILFGEDDNRFFKRENME